MTGSLLGVVRRTARPWVRLAREPEFRTLCRLRLALQGVPRHRECRARVHGLDLVIPDAASFLASYREIFVERTLAFHAAGDAPRILDLGANIGMSVLYFKRLYPRARVTALEPDPAMFPCLTRNVHGNGFTDVTLIQRAAWHSTTRLEFLPDGADGGRTFAAGAEPMGAKVEVESVDVPALLGNERFDFVKMDIEGAEHSVLPACADALGGVRQIFVEYHGSSSVPSAMGAVLGTLERSGFHVQVHTVRSAEHPLLESGDAPGCDLILHLYGSRA